MDCNGALSLLEAYLDKELDRAEARELERHLDGCPDCRAALTRLDVLRLALRDRSLRHGAPAALRERIAAAAANTDASAVPPLAARRTRLLPAWWRVAAACVLAFASGAAFMHLSNSGHADDPAALVEHDLFASHWRALAAASPVDVVSSDRHTVKPWFAGKVAQAPLVQDFAEQGFPLVGGRIDYVGAQRVPVLVYRHGRHLIDVFVLPQEAGTTSVVSVARLGYTLDPVMLGAQQAAIVSDMDPQELANFGRLLAQQGRAASAPTQ
jgi:anti-sigma factor (TIGR02949 family)